MRFLGFWTQPILYSEQEDKKSIPVTSWELINFILRTVLSMIFLHQTQIMENILSIKTFYKYYCKLNFMLVKEGESLQAILLESWPI